MEHLWWLKEVRSLPTSRYDRWAFECCDKFSQQVMLAAPNAMGHLGNDEFVLAVMRCIGQLNYIIRSMEGLYFGKKGERVNAHATNLCCAPLPGGGFRILHDQVKTLIITFLRLARRGQRGVGRLMHNKRAPDDFFVGAPSVGCSGRASVSISLKYVLKRA